MVCRQYRREHQGDGFRTDQFHDASRAALHGTWKGKFDESATREEKFYGADRTSTVQMMHNDKLAVRYAANDDLQVLLLPYGNEAYSMGIVLPGEGVSIRQAGQSLAADWKKLADKTVSLQVDLKLPKFKLVYETSLIEAAQALGIKDAFLSVADFSKLTDSDLYITLFKQKSLIDVDEKGTEASSVTIIGGDTSPGPGDTPEASTIVVDHPFLFFIQEKSTGLMLFMGKIENL